MITFNHPIIWCVCASASTKISTNILLMTFSHPSVKGNLSALCPSLPAVTFSPPLVWIRRSQNVPVLSVRCSIEVWKKAEWLKSFVEKLWRCFSATVWAVINLAIRQSNTKIGCVHLPVPSSWRITLRYRTLKKKNADGKNIQAWLHLCRWHLHLDQIGGDCIRDGEHCSLLVLNMPTLLQSERAQKLINVHVLLLLFVETFKTGQTDRLEEHFHTTEARELVYWHFLTS